MSKTQLFGMSIRSILFLVVVGVVSWTLYELIKVSMTDALARFGIESVYLQGVIIIALGFLTLILLGFGAKKVFKEVID